MQTRSDRTGTGPHPVLSSRTLYRSLACTCVVQEYEYTVHVARGPQRSMKSRFQTNEGGSGNDTDLLTFSQSTIVNTSTLNEEH